MNRYVRYAVALALVAAPVVVANLQSNPVATADVTTATVVPEDDKWDSVQAGAPVRPGIVSLL